MGPFVVLAVALAALSTGVAVVAAVHLFRRMKRLTRAVEQAGARLTPLVEELQSEAAVTALEVEALQRRSEQSRSPGPR
jgi:hypothetical protein